MALLTRRKDTVAKSFSERPGAASRTSTTRDGRAVVSSAMPIIAGDKREASRLAKVRQSWQPEAWVYRRTLGELRYAANYLGNSCMRLRLYPGVFKQGENTPVEITGADKQGLPSDLVDAVLMVMGELGNGSPIGAATLMKTLTENFQIAGECYLIGRPDDINRDQYNWKIYSISEVIILKDGKVGLRELPGNNQADIEWLDPDIDKISRLWTPDPEWRLLADSPVRGILDVCEELLLVGRDVRSTIRSRLANNGLLLVPDNLSIIGPSPEADDDEEDGFFKGLMDAAEANLTSEGDASAAVPIIVRGPGDALTQIKHMVLDRPQNKFNINQRAELISRMATGIDLPAEVLTGKIDLNHWTSWQVDDDTFRHHVEPTAIQEVNALTIGYMWRRLDAMGKWSPELVRSITIWYDPTELVTHPDRTADAILLHDRFSLSDKALRTASGFVDTDAPDDSETLRRLALRLRSLDPSIQGQILQGMDPTIEVPPPRSGTNDNNGDDTRDTKQDPAPPAAQPGPPPEPSPAPPSAAAKIAAMRSRSNGTSLRARIASAALEVSDPVATYEPNMALSRSLMDIDRRLRERVHTAANTAIRRAIERAGARVVSRARGAAYANVRELIRDVPVGLVPATLGMKFISTMGFSEDTLLETEYAEMRRQWDQWVSDAQSQALRDVAAAVSIDFDILASSLAATFAADAQRGWDWVQKAMSAAASILLSSVDEIDDLSTADLITVSQIRAALALAGGFGEGTSSGINSDGLPVDPSEMMGQIGTGDTISNVLVQNGFGREGYEWVWGGSMNAFQPHLSLNGKQYTSWADSELSAPTTTFPSGGQYYPGDHTGCSCDFMPIIIPVTESSSGAAA